MRTVTATTARSDLFNIIRDSVQTHQPYQITSRSGEAVLLSKDDFDSLMETLELLSTPGLLEGVRQARKDIDSLSPKLRLKLKDILVHGLAKNQHMGKKLLGDLAGSNSYRLSLKDRIVYSVDDAKRIVSIERARTHCGQ